MARKHTTPTEHSARQAALDNARSKGAAVTARDIAEAIGLAAAASPTPGPGDNRK